MSTKRLIMVGWDRPLCETVPEFLLAEGGPGCLDLRGTVVVVPTRQSSWRLRAALPLAAEARGRVLLGLEMVTPPVLLEPPPSADTATAFQCLWAWVAVLKSIPPGECAAFLGPRDERAAGVAGSLQIARRLQELRRELADGGWTPADVPERAADLLEEGERWRDLIALEERYLRQLSAGGLVDPIRRKWEYARRGVLPPGIRRVVVAAVPDPPQALIHLLEGWAASGGAVDWLVAAPESERAAFDEWGRPRFEAWGGAEREIPIPAADLSLHAQPDDQAAAIRAALESGRPEFPPAPSHRPNVAIGVPDRETVAPLRRELAAIGWPAFDPQNPPFAETPLFRLVQALLAFRRRPGYAEVAALLRHPDVLEACGGEAALLQTLDAFQADRLPVDLNDCDGAPEPLAGALARLREWLLRLNRAPLAAGLRAVLADLYRERLLKSDDPADAAFQQAVSVLDAALRELEGAGGAGRGDEEAAEILLVRLQESPIKAERRDERIDLEGWLELAWNPAPLLWVAGLNEGYVPDGHIGDLFLPDAMRHRLGLRDDRLRSARDAYVLTALLAQRRTSGRVFLLVGKTSAAGDPLRPSRLLFRCPDSELVARARRLFQDPPPAPAAEAFTLSFRLDPAQAAAEGIDPRRAERLSVTAFRDYLACPLRFYLRHVLGMEAKDDRAREPDALAFGTVIHAVLNEMAQAREWWACSDPDALGRWLEERIRAQFRGRYGVRPWLGVELALDTAAQRLKAFAARQVEHCAQGWEIVAAECEAARALTLAGVRVTGRIDRVDRHRETGRWWVYDYKTTDQARDPAEAHLGPARDDEPFAESVFEGLLPAASGARASRRTRWRWVDLQLPIYRELARPRLGPDVGLGYIVLPRALGETGFREWAAYPEALHDSARRCAEAVADRIRRGVFWPPGAVSPSRDREWASVLLGDPERTLLPPPSPWGGAP